MAEIILNGLTAEDLLKKIDEIVNNRLTEALQKLQTDEADKLLSVDITCGLFIPKISRQTLHSWTTQGLIPCHRIGRSVYYKFSDILKASEGLKKIVRSTLKAA